MEFKIHIFQISEVMKNKENGCCMFDLCMF